jgi:ligand-binding sensor domain-containing protein
MTPASLQPCFFLWLRRALPVLLFITTMPVVQAQYSPSRRYTTRDGLIADRITAITQDEDGFMWMGSLFGISKYDGSKFTTLPLPPAQKYKAVTSLLATDNKLYAGFILGGGLMEYHDGQVKEFMIPKSLSASNDVTGIYKADTGIVVVNSSNQVFRFSENDFRYLFSLDSSYSPSSILAVYVEKNGRVWTGTPNGVKIFERGKMVKTVLPGCTISHIRETGKGMMVVGSDERKSFVRIFPGANDYSPESNLIWESPSFLMTNFYSNQSAGYWGVDGRLGLVNVSENGKVEFLATSLNAQSEIKYIFSDRENNLWIASDPGVVKISNAPVTTYAFNELAAGGGDIVEVREGEYWINNSKNLYRINRDGIMKAQEFREKSNYDYLAILFADEKNDLWVSGWNRGIWKLKYQKEKLVSREFFPEYLGKKIIANCTAKDKNGNTWIGGLNGIFHIRNGKIIDHFPVTLQNGATAFITAMVVDEEKNTIWLGENTAGILKLSYREAGDKFVYALSDYLDAAKGLKDGYIRSLFLDSQKNLWIGTRLGGIYRLTERGRDYSFSAVGSPPNISCSRVTDISEESGEAVWFATCDGILRYSLKNAQWQKYGVSDGLIGAEVFSLSASQKDKEVWAVSGEGVTVIKFNDDNDRHPPPLVNIVGLSIVGREDSTALYAGGVKKLSTDENSIGFVFAGASYTDEKKIRYKYILQGYDKDWSKPIESNSVNYLNLPFGNYTFKVLAWNGYRWSEQPAIFSFRIIRPFYKSPWFAVLIVGFLAVSFYFVRTYRLRQKLKLEKLRLTIARDLHDDIGSALGSINLLSENANRHLSAERPVEEVAGVFQKIGYSAQTVLDSMDDIIWAINPEKDSLDDLLLRMREFAIPLLEAKNIRFDFHMHAAENIKPSMEMKRNIYLVFKEAIFNVVKHSGCTAVKIRGEFGAKDFLVSVSDNGRGFNTGQISSRNGLKNMRKRASISGLILQIDSVPGSGTTIRLQGTLR